MNIGTFAQTPLGEIIGKTHGLGIGVTPVVFNPHASKDGKNYFKVIADPNGDAYQIGVAFVKKKDGKTFYSVSLDSPAFNSPIKALLFPDREHEGSLNLVWDRQDAVKSRPSANAESEQAAPRRFTGAIATP